MIEPRWLAEARKLLGTREIPGAASNRVIEEMHRRVSGVAHKDDVPWCAAFVGWCLEQAGIESTNNLMARSYAGYGLAVPKTGRLPTGGIATFWRGSPRSAFGHVGFVVGSDARYVSVLGGNQSDAVTIASHRRDKLLAVRWPPGEAASLAAAVYHGLAGGAVDPSGA